MAAKGVFFDMDGVVVDSDSLWTAIIMTVRKEYELDMSCLEKCDGYNLSAREAIGLVLEKTGRLSCGLLDGILTRLDTLYSVNRDMLSLMPGIAETLEMLYERGVATALVSNSSRLQTDMVLDRFGIRKYFPVTVTADDVVCGKPDPEPYLRALELSGLSADGCVAVEDSLTGLASATGAGLHCILSASHETQDLRDYVMCRGICLATGEKLREKLDKLTRDEEDH